MNVKVLHEIVKKDNTQGGLYNLFEPNFNAREDLPLNEYEVKKGEEMRIDLIFQSMYQIEPEFLQYDLDKVDIILNINQIDNPLNIIEGMILKYPSKDELDNYRVVDDPFKVANNNLTNKLVVPNVSRKIDSKRKQYVDNGYSFPPTVSKQPRDPVVVEGGQFFVGGV